MNKMILLALSTIALTSLAATADARPQSRSGEKLNEMPLDDGTKASGGIQWPKASKVQALCDTPGPHKWRSVTITRAGYNPQNPGTFDFMNQETLLGLSTVIVFLNSSHTESVECYRELITFSLGHLETTPRGSFAPLTVTIDENTRVLSQHLDDNLTSVRTSQPYDYSTSSYYRDILRKEFSMVSKSLMKLPTGTSVFKAKLNLIAARDSKYHVPNTQWEASAASATEPLYISIDAVGINSFTNNMLSTVTRSFYDGGAKTCPIVPEAQIAAAIYAGANLQDIYTTYYDAQNPQSACSQAK
jgi:hypothetical protein